MRDFERTWKWLLSEYLYLLFPMLVTLVFGALVPFNNPWAIILTFFVLSILLVILPYLKARYLDSLYAEYRSTVAQLRQELAQVSSREETTAVQRRILDKAMEGLSDVLRDCVRELKEANDACQGCQAGGDLTPMRDLGEKAKQFTHAVSKRALGKLQEILNDPGNIREPVRDARVTLFTLTDDTPGRRVLSYYAHSYPAALSPQTLQITELENRTSGAIQCLLTENMVIVPDIPIAAEQAERRHPNGWQDFRPGQHLEYGSIVCYPVIVGEPRQVGRHRFIGVISITVKNRGFFQDDPPIDPPADYVTKEFITKVLHPFALTIAIVSELERSGRILHQTLTIS